MNNNESPIKTEIYDQINLEKRLRQISDNTYLDEQRKNKLRIKKAQIRKKKIKRNALLAAIASTLIISASVYAGTKLGASIEDKAIARNVIEMEANDIVDEIRMADSKEEVSAIINSYIDKNMEVSSFRNDDYARSHAEGYTVWKIMNCSKYKSNEVEGDVKEKLLEALGVSSLDELAQRDGFFGTYSDGKTNPGGYSYIVDHSKGYYDTEVSDKVEGLKGVTK